MHTRAGIMSRAVRTFHSSVFGLKLLQRLEEKKNFIIKTTNKTIAFEIQKENISNKDILDLSLMYCKR